MSTDNFDDLNRDADQMPNDETSRKNLDELIAQLHDLPLESQQEIVKSLLQPFTDWIIHAQHAPVWEDAGFHVVPNMFYSPLPDFQNLPEEVWARESDLLGIDMNDERQLQILEDALYKYLPELEELPVNPTDNEIGFYWDNGMYTGVDAVTLHGMIRHFKPRRIIEIGAGFSTMISTRAAAMNGNTSAVTSIEPYPRPFLKKLPNLESLIVSRIQDVDLAIFDVLEENDILFIDTSHVVVTDGDVNRIYLDLLPRIKKGVHIHIHDIFLPREYPRYWVINERRAWNEQYMLQALLQFSDKFTVSFATTYMLTRHAEATQRLKDRVGRFGGSSIWLTTLK